METYNGYGLTIEKKGETTTPIINDALLEIDGFHIRAYHEFEAYFDPPTPYLDLELTSAAVIGVVGGRSVLLVELATENGVRRVEFPSGKVAAGDPSIFHTAVRELWEETGGLIPIHQIRPFMVRPHQDGRGGLQFIAEIPRVKVSSHDNVGRGYLNLPEGTDKGKAVRLITEPLTIFLDPNQTLLRYSRHQWAVDDAVRLTLALFQLNLDTRS